MKVMIAVVVIDSRKVSEQDKATTVPVDSECESDEHLSWERKQQQLNTYMYVHTHICGYKINAFV